MATGRSIGTGASRAAIAGVGWALIALMTRAESPLVTVETHDDSFVGELVTFNAEQGVRLRRDNSIRLPLAEVLNVRFERRYSPVAGPRRSAGEIELVDGSVLIYQESDQIEETLALRLTEGSRAELPLSGVRRWWFSPERPAEDRSNATARVADVLWVRPKQEEGLTPVEGVVLGLSDDGVRFAFSGEEASEAVVAPWDRLAGIEFFREASTTGAPNYLVRLSGGGRIAADHVRIHGGRLEWESRHGDGDLDLGEIELIDSSAGRVTPVSNLKLLEATWKPFYDQGGLGPGYALDSSFAGGPLRLREPDPRVPRAWPTVGQERSCGSGVALKSRGVMRFALPTGATRLKGWIGLDPACVRSGSAEVTLLAGDRVIWTGVVDGATRPVELNAPLHGAATLTLRVDYGDNLDAGDHVHFGELRVIQ